MSKRNIAYVKPQDPSFLRRIKEQIGYKEGPTVDTKRQKLGDLSGSEGESDNEGHWSGGVRAGGRNATGAGEDEAPQVVVVQEGDLTAEEAEAERVRLEKEEREKPADLTQRIVFKAKHKPSKDSDNDLSVGAKKDCSQEKKSKKKGKESKKVQSAKLSFAQEEDEEEEHF